ncbi:MAG: twin-arginine translocase TatA/TatE family subunit [Kiritimatiellia bacterium]
MLAFILESAGFGEWFVLLAVLLVVVGPRQLPSAARKLGQYYNRFRRAAESFKRQLMDMDTEFTRAAQETGKAAEDAFRLEEDGKGNETPAESTSGASAPSASGESKEQI